MSRRGMSIASLLIALVLSGIAFSALSIFIVSSSKINQEIAQDVDLEIFKLKVYNVLASTQYTQKILLAPDLSPLTFVPMTQGTLPVPVVISKIKLLDKTYSLGDDLGGGLTLEKMEVVSSFNGGAVTWNGVNYSKYIVDISITFGRDTARSTGAKPKPWVLTVPLLVNVGAPQTIEFAGFNQIGSLAGDVVEFEAMNITAGGALGASCDALGGTAPMLNVRLDASLGYKFCGLRGVQLIPKLTSSGEAVDDRRYRIEKRADGYFWLVFRSHIWEQPQNPVVSWQTNKHAWGSCDLAPQQVSIQYSCIK